MRHLPRSPRAKPTHREAAAGSLRRTLRALPLALSLALLAVPSARGQIYKWTDETGAVHFTDSLHGVPPRYRAQVGTMDDRLPPPAAARVIPLEANELGYLVEARLNGTESVRLILDTGATSTVLSPGVARRLGLTVRTEPPVVVRTAGGTVHAGMAEVDEIEVGGRRAGPVQVVVHDAVSGADGLLGMNFLGLFRVELRADEPALLLSPR